MARPRGTAIPRHGIGGGERARRRRREPDGQDLLTPAASRAAVQDRLDAAVAASRRHGKPLAVLSLRLDDFPDPGMAPDLVDTILVEVASRLLHTCRTTDLVGRWGHAEFVAVVEHVDGVAGAAVAADRLLAAVRDPFSTSTGTVRLTASIGLALAPEPHVSTTEVLGAAHAARGHAAGEGGDTYRVAEPAAPVEAATLEDLRRGIDTGELHLRYQPQVDLRTGLVTFGEALLRWQRRDGEPVLHAGQFVHLVDNTELSSRLGRWTLHRAVRDLAAWHAALRGPRLAASVNVSGHHLLHGDLVADVKDALSAFGMDPRHLELEVPERVLGRDPDRVVPVLHDVAALGVRIALDGFGMGQSSLALLPDLPIRALKLDETLGDRLAGNGAALVAGLVGLARELRLQVVVPRVEHTGQLRRARQLGCHRAQGRLLSPPLPASDMTNGPPPALAQASDHHVRRG